MTIAVCPVYFQGVRSWMLEARHCRRGRRISGDAHHRVTCSVLSFSRARQTDARSRKTHGYLLTFFAVLFRAVV